MASSSERLLADTHVLVWHLASSSRLSGTARQLMRRADARDIELIVPTMVLAEALHISERRNPDVSFEQVMNYLTAMPNAVIAALDMPIIREARQLSSALEMHDRLIVATARVYDAIIITRDQQLRSLARTVW